MGERVVPRKPQQHPERPGRDLRVQPAARLVRGRREIQLLTPEVRVGIDLDQREAQRAVDLLPEPAHPLQFDLRRNDVLARSPLGRQLEHRATACGERPTEREQLILGGEGSRHRLTVHRPVRQRAR